MMTSYFSSTAHPFTSSALGKVDAQAIAASSSTLASPSTSSLPSPSPPASIASEDLPLSSTRSGNTTPSNAIALSGLIRSNLGRRRKASPAHPQPAKRGPKPKTNPLTEKRKQREIVKPNIQVILPSSRHSNHLIVSHLSSPYATPVPLRPVSILRSSNGLVVFGYKLQKDKEAQGVIRVQRGKLESEHRVVRKGALRCVVKEGGGEAYKWSVVEEV